MKNLSKLLCICVGAISANPITFRIVLARTVFSVLLQPPTIKLVSLFIALMVMLRL